MRNFQSFYGASWEDSHWDGNLFHSQGSSVSGFHPGVLPCSVLAPCRSGARSVRNNWVSPAQPLNISWIFLPDFSRAELPAPFIGNKGTCWEFCPRQLREVGSGPGTAPELSLPRFLGIYFLPRAAGRKFGKEKIPKDETEKEKERWECQ